MRRELRENIQGLLIINDVGNEQYFCSSAGPRMANAATAVAAASSNLRTFGTKSGTAPKSAMKIAHDLMRSKGISGIYKGLGATLARYTYERWL